jgi:hypothetical protein
MWDRESFLALSAVPPTVEAVDTPHGMAHVRVMTAREKDRFEADHAKDTGRDFRARVVAATCCDEAGVLLFTVKDIPQLSALPASELDPIVKVAIRLNAMGQEEVEEIRKKSESPDDDDSSDSRVPLDGPRRNSSPPSRALS